MENKNNTIKELRILIAKNEVKNALEKLKNLIVKDDSLQSDQLNLFIHIHRRYLVNQSKYLKGVISYDGYLLEENRICESILSIIDNFIPKEVHITNSKDNIIQELKLSLKERFENLVDSIINCESSILNKLIKYNEMNDQIINISDKNKISELEEKVDKLKTELRLERNNYNNLKKQYARIEKDNINLKSLEELTKFLELQLKEERENQIGWEDFFRTTYYEELEKIGRQNALLIKRLNKIKREK